MNKNSNFSTNQEKIYPILRWRKVHTLEAEGMVLRAISLILEKEEGMRSLIGRFAKCTTLLPNLLAIFMLLCAFGSVKVCISAVILRSFRGFLIST